ncbi:PepSY-like domain-containing protein [Saccharicrinis fermentans]|uniref:Uncharacterized protein n=1 Tax=Saccharicrinis fermentans DSM 9555 = JCM 21142 TaxID=869213 RepID=W7Y6G0_9BACT|nr:PepSY-like domain-containing protein [Saccharicrinis fermentans]GAF03213.1 hypothetical protein JCM21142_41878 [Saccharicrinis fermentans DSM 9555 = JCM 21142]
MKKQLLLISMLMLAVTFAFAQNVNVPKVVKAAFDKKYPGAENPVWKKANTNFQVHFKKDTKQQAYFSPDGKWLKTAIVIDEEELPEASVKYIQESYEEYELKQAQKIVTNTGKTSYMVILMVDEEKVKLGFNASGEYVVK